MRGILADTVSEMVDRKMVWVYSGVALLGLLAILVTRSVEMQFQTEGLNMQAMNELWSPRLWLYNKFMYYMVFLSVLVTAGLIPNMLSKGRVDFYLSKPLSRRQHLLTKMAAVWMVYGGLMVLIMILVGSVGAWAFGAVDTGLGYIVLSNLLAFFIWLVVTTFAGVWSSSAPMSILAVFLMWILQQILSWHDAFSELIDSPFWGKLVDVFYYVVPKTIEISEATLRLAGGNPVDWMPFYTSVAFALVLMYVTVFMFNRKDY
ncbi:MAG: hypothetical protein OEV49_03140 [candidate division Zixibacteria bacterium]|nr:hypothetical protein [candidate division Zixibacteria bacterium]MDH3939076.1 hypothetical protein [candidate division Zixibacteria bacterium]MDH4032359.1 hypothetical protein [candidate division Zixibacteria bacterium]